MEFGTVRKLLAKNGLHNVRQGQDSNTLLADIAPGFGTVVVVPRHGVAVEMYYSLAVQSKSITLEWVNEWNQNYNDLQMFLDQEGDPVLKVVALTGPAKEHGPEVLKTALIGLVTGMKMLHEHALHGEALDDYLGKK